MKGHFFSLKLSGSDWVLLLLPAPRWSGFAHGLVCYQYRRISHALPEHTSLSNTLLAVALRWLRATYFNNSLPYPVHVKYFSAKLSHYHSPVAEGSTAGPPFQTHVSLNVMSGCVHYRAMVFVEVSCREEKLCEHLGDSITMLLSWTEWQ